jgi:hypothetical protein
MRAPPLADGRTAARPTRRAVAAARAGGPALAAAGPALAAAGAAPVRLVAGARARPTLAAAGAAPVPLVAGRAWPLAADARSCAPGNGCARAIGCNAVAAILVVMAAIALVAIAEVGPGWGPGDDLPPKGAPLVGTITVGGAEVVGARTSEPGSDTTLTADAGPAAEVEGNCEAAVRDRDRDRHSDRFGRVVPAVVHGDQRRYRGHGTVVAVDLDSSSRSSRRRACPTTSARGSGPARTTSRRRTWARTWSRTGTARASRSRCCGTSSSARLAASGSSAAATTTTASPTRPASGATTGPSTGARPCPPRAGGTARAGAGGRRAR